MKLTKILFAALIIFTSANTFAQVNKKGPSGDTNEASHNLTIKIPKVALLDLEGNTDITFNGAITEAGNALEFSETSTSNIWINYSSIVDFKTTRTISVYVNADDGDTNVPDGLELKVLASKYSGNGKGSKGIAKPAIILTSDPQPIINGIGSVYTGNGINNGHKLTYTLSATDDSYTDIESESPRTIEIVYTLTDN